MSLHVCVWVCVYCVNTSRRPVFILDYPIMPLPLPPSPTARISAVCQHRQAKTSTHMHTHTWRGRARPCVLLLFTSQGTEQKAKWALRQKEKKHSVCVLGMRIGKKISIVTTTIIKKNVYTIKKMNSKNTWIPHCFHDILQCFDTYP